MARTNRLMNRLPRNEMSPEFRENMQSMLSSLQSRMTADIAEARNIDPSKIDTLMKTGFLVPDAAREAGFVDTIAYSDDAIRSIMSSHMRGTAKVSVEKFLEEESFTSEWGESPVIAVITASGSIVQGSESGGGIFGRSNAISDGEYYRMIEEAFSDSNVKAVVIRIDSGGGSAAASDFMWHHLSSMKKRYDKPVVFSFGNTAASGGYYIACTGDTVFADNATITGSIGVIMGKVSVKGLMEKIGISRDVVKTSDFADMFSLGRELTEKERKILQNGVEFTYQQFTSKVCTARKLSPDSVPQFAEGRVYSEVREKIKVLLII